MIRKELEKLKAIEAYIDENLNKPNGLYAVKGYIEMMIYQAELENKWREKENMEK